MIFIGADHRGYNLKEVLKIYLKELSLECEDLGAKKFNPEDDYPDFVIPVAKAVAGNPLARGIIIGGSGQGEAICANKFSGVRAVVFNGNPKEEKGESLNPKKGLPLDEIILSREHNDANILSLGARFLNFDETKEAVSKWLATPFSKEERHIRRLSKIENLRHRL